MSTDTRWSRFLHCYGYPITAAYLIIMVTIIVVLLIEDPTFPCNC